MSYKTGDQMIWLCRAPNSQQQDKKYTASSCSNPFWLFKPYHSLSKLFHIYKEARR